VHDIEQLWGRLKVPAKPFDTLSIGGVPFQVCSFDESIDWTLKAASERESRAIRLTNAYCVALAQSEAEYMHLLSTDGVNFPDSLHVARTMQTMDRLGGAFRRDAGRVRGPSYFESTLSRGRTLGIRHFFLGATPETLDQLTRNVGERFPGVIVSGTHAPPFAPVDEEWIRQMASIIRASDPDIVWVGLGTPKQDYAASALAVELNCCVAGVGAAFDFVASTAKQAPKWVQDSGFEWFFRLVTEPRRLWRRYVLGNPVFLWVALRSVVAHVLDVRGRKILTRS
jgi:N-acetylglucosaminyldiphosphoundecaprenol N-acetyl-beta-D-mannosaminyltransferase